MSAVFGQAEKSPPDQVQTAQGYAVFQVLAIKPASTPTFEEIRSRVEDEFRNERVAALLTQKTQELADRAKAEHDLKKAAKEAGATIKTSDFVLPDGQVPDIGSMSGGASVAFSLKIGRDQRTDQQRHYRSGVVGSRKSRSRRLRILMPRRTRSAMRSSRTSSRKCLACS